MKKNYGPKNFKGIKGQAIIDQLRSEYNEYFDQAVEDIKKKKKKSPIKNSFQIYLNKQKEKTGETKLNGPGASKEWNKRAIFDIFVHESKCKEMRDRRFESPKSIPRQDVYC